MRFVLVVVVALMAGGRVGAANPVPQDASPKAIYDQIKAFTLSGGTADVSQLTLKRDRVEMTFTGTFHFAAPVAGRVSGAVFTGQGTMRVEAPPSDFERDNIKRMLGAELVESDFRTAVLRFTDDTFDVISAGKRDGAAPAAAQRLANEADARFTVQTGANLAARVTLSILNAEKPGFFAAEFDGGRRDRFNAVIDHQGRIPVSFFGLNGGEKGLVFAYQSTLYVNDTWLAFRAVDDYAKKDVDYSDANDLIDVTHYRLNMDVRDFNREIVVRARMDLKARSGNVRAVHFNIGESLPVFQEMRLKKQLRLKQARLGDAALEAVQEDWEGGFTVFLSRPATAGESITLEVELAGDFVEGVPAIPECFYPLDNVTWLPRHGYLDRATFDTTFRHRKRDEIASIGVRSPSQPDPEDPEAALTRFQMTEPVALAVFAIGPWERKTQQVTWEAGGKAIPLEFNSVPSRVLSRVINPRTGTPRTSISHQFLLAELDNAVRYFAAFFGRYPYDTFGAAFHPFGFGQGFPTLLMIPPADSENKYTHSFIAHETAHQWWGNIVAWRSYRDQWLSEGFAQYSALLYAGKRDREKEKAAADLIKEYRESLLNPPRTALGVGRGRLNDIGPIILGLRLNTSKTLGAYQTLIYNKGALVLRMLHFLMTDLTTMNDAAFVAMMKDFVERHRNGAAATENFAAVASEHFARTAVARKFGLRDLNWFFRQWIYNTDLPTYTLEYTLKPEADGSVIASGVVKQDNAGPDWMMVLPVTFTFAGNQEARTTVRVSGASTPFELKLPTKPAKVELDPNLWVLSEKTITKGR